MSPRVSVVVPMFNVERYIGECLQSLIGQSFSDFEAIVVDDCSVDGSVLAAKESVVGDPRFSFFELSANGGQSIARNVALEHASGEYLVLLDADDYLVSDALEKLIDRADRQDLDDLYFSGRSFYESAQAHSLVREDFSNRPSFDEVASGLELFTYFVERDAFFPQAPLRMVRRSLVERNGIRFYEGIIHEDLLFTMQTLLESKRSSFLNEDLYMRRVHMGSTMTKPRRTIANVHGHFVCMHELQKWLDCHIDDLELSFIQAVSKQIALFRNIMATDWYSDITEEEKRDYLDSLTNAQRLEFLEYAIAPGFFVQELLNSRTYRVGDAVVSAPRAIRDRIKEFISYRNER